MYSRRFGLHISFGHIRAKSDQPARAVFENTKLVAICLEVWQGLEYCQKVSFINPIVMSICECVLELKKGAAASEAPSVIMATIDSISSWEGSGGGSGAKVD
jgi:hypothetical protein